MLGFHSLGRQALGATTGQTFAAATAPTYTANLVLSGTGFSLALSDTLSGTGHTLSANTSAAGTGTAITLDSELTTQVD